MSRRLSQVFRQWSRSRKYSIVLVALRRLTSGRFNSVDFAGQSLSFFVAVSWSQWTVVRGFMGFPRFLQPVAGVARGLEHGTWTALALAYPGGVRCHQAKISVVIGHETSRVCSVLCCMCVFPRSMLEVRGVQCFRPVYYNINTTQHMKLQPLAK